ncbi:hypothetical protein IGS61_02185 [Janthinobacterium sp. FW305-129]|uniref:hypothetical protein n=1 Tax=Janthinobacterium sp. FW305-129 TaxID=2775054 RepID=UPI001E400977|nr:hypothetical protein [Janthinobacterium sp. FW305-129]MCC7596278.1 hypothetical protein [Janthinobacterium sp. FW305-129]
MLLDHLYLPLATFLSGVVKFSFLEQIRHQRHAIDADQHQQRADGAQRGESFLPAA